MEIGAEKEFIGHDCLIELPELEINIIQYCEEQAPVGHEVFTLQKLCKASVHIHREDEGLEG
jgi:hypothetical protein